MKTKVSVLNNEFELICDMDNQDTEVYLTRANYELPKQIYLLTISWCDIDGFIEELRTLLLTYQI
jgi:hypothetical protein